MSWDTSFPVIEIGDNTQLANLVKHLDTPVQAGPSILCNTTHTIIILVTMW